MSVTMDPVFFRVLKAGLLAFAAALVGGFAGCAGLLFAVRNSHDGQAGMGVIVIGPCAALLVGGTTFVVSMVLSGREVKEETE